LTAKRLTIWIAATVSQPTIRTVAPRRSGSTQTVGGTWPRLSTLAIEASNDRQWAIDGAGTCGSRAILRSSIPIVSGPSGRAATTAYRAVGATARLGAATGDMTRFPTGMSDLPFHIGHYADVHFLPTGRVSVAKQLNFAAVARLVCCSARMGVCSVRDSNHVGAVFGTPGRRPCVAREASLSR
jgi:hypothetical protein